MKSRHDGRAVPDSREDTAESDPARIHRHAISQPHHHPHMRGGGGLRFLKDGEKRQHTDLSALISALFPKICLPVISDHAIRPAQGNLPEKVMLVATVFERLMRYFPDIIRSIVLKKRTPRIFDLDEIRSGQFCMLPIKY